MPAQGMAADWQVGGVLAVVVGNGALPLDQAAELILKAKPEEAEDESESLVESGQATAVLCQLLTAWAANKEDAPAAAWKQSSLRIESFFPEVKWQLWLVLHCLRKDLLSAEHCLPCHPGLYLCIPVVCNLSLSP